MRLNKLPIIITIILIITFSFFIDVTPQNKLQKLHNQNKPEKFKINLDINKNYQKKNDSTIVLDVDVSAYTSREIECDSTPFIAAWNNKLDPKKHKKEIIAVSRDLLNKYGLNENDKVIVYLNNKKYIFTVLDKMNKRYKKTIDIYFGTDVKSALEFGRRKAKLFIRRNKNE